MWWYNIGIGAFTLGIRIAAGWKPKARLWIEGRRGLLEKMAATITSDEPLVWVHAASLGEFEQGRPVIEAIRATHPGYKILLTFFSPSGYEVRKTYAGADYVFYLPSDSPRHVRRFLDIAKPSVAIIIKYEFWLNYLAELGRRGCPTYLISAIFRRDSVFFRPYGSAFRRALRVFSKIFVQNTASKELLANIGVTHVEGAGDTRFDRVAKIAEAARRLEIVDRFCGGRKVFVAGSTWAPDEELLMRLIRTCPEQQFIVAPHEMEQERIERLLAAAGERGIRYTDCERGASPEGKQLLVIDTIGILSSVYAYASMAYIGGGFGVGIHNILEAATFGLPLAFGPNYGKFREAVELVDLGAAKSISCYEELEAWFSQLIADESLREKLGAAAVRYVHENCGATEQIVHEIFG